jgi:hypothetical protein
MHEMMGGVAASAQGGAGKVIGGAIAAGGKGLKTPFGATHLMKLLNADTGLMTAAELLAETPGAASAAASWLSKSATAPGKFAIGLQQEADKHPTFDTWTLMQAVADNINKDPKYYDRQRTPLHIKADYKSGIITRDEAANELRSNHAFQ